MSETCEPTQTWNKCADEAKAWEAVEALTIASRWFPNDPHIFNRLGSLLTALREWDRADTIIKRAKELIEDKENKALTDKKRENDRKDNERLQELYVAAFKQYQLDEKRRKEEAEGKKRRDEEERRKKGAK